MADAPRQAEAMTEPEMIDAAEANIRADYRAGRISKEQFQKEMLIMARARRQAQPAPPSPQTNVDGEAEIASVVQSVNEWDDRTSPDDYPDHLLITSEELAEILRNFAATLEGSAE